MLPAVEQADPAPAPGAPVPSEGVLRLNIALQANGGKVEQIQPAGDAKYTPNLNDGYSSDWRITGKQLPQDFVFGFFAGRTASVERVVINTLTKETVDRPDLMPRAVEVWASLTIQSNTFKKIASVDLPKKAGRHTINFFPTPASHLRVRIKSTHGQALQFGDIEIYEEAGQPSILEGQPVNIAAAGNGGAVALFTATSSDAAWLIDGHARGWHTDGAARKTDVVFAFNQDREALVERVILMPRSQHPADWMARRGKILISRATPSEGFEEVADFEIARDAREVEVPVGRRARFLKLAIIDNHAGKNSSLGEVRILEGSEPGYRPVLLDTSGESVNTNATVVEGEREAEPNNSADQAGLLSIDTPLDGVIKPLGDEDFFTLEIDKPKFPEVSLELRGKPYIRTSLTLHQDGRELARFDPTNAAGGSVIIKFPVTNGAYALRVFEPPTSLLLVYDASSSMTPSMTNLRVAVDSYLDNLRPSVQVNLVRFDSKVETVLPEFTSDQARLKEAVAQKFAVGKGTAFFDAVGKGCELLEKISGNRAMIVMTDGSDSASKTNYPNFWKMVENRKIRLYTVGFGNEMDVLSDKMGTTPRRMMQHVALATHGRSFMSETAEELKGLYEAISDEIRQVSGYSLLAFWGDQPPALEVQAGNVARHRGASGRRISGLRYFLFTLGGLAGLGIIVGIVWSVLSSRKSPKPSVNRWRK